MKVQLLPSTIDADGKASVRQHLLTMIVDDTVAIDAGCLALSCSDVQRRQIRDIILTHTHLDHIAGLPLFIDDLFSTLKQPVTVHATKEMIETLERDIFNWSIYPRFSELTNDHGPVIAYSEFVRGSRFQVKHLAVQSIAVNHKVSATGFVISDGKSSVAITGDTAPTEDIWRACNAAPNLKAVLVECAFPNELSRLAAASFHLTPATLAGEVAKLYGRDFPVYIINLKPMFRDRVVEQIAELKVDGLEILELQKVYDF
jgi:ribonuclease BN (tRNA processing enzyme)